MDIWRASSAFAYSVHHSTAGVDHHVRRCLQKQREVTVTERERAEFNANIEQRLLQIARNTENIIRDLNEEFYRAERAKREIDRVYWLRRLRRLAGLAV
jgi:hypothetical protein